MIRLIVGLGNPGRQYEKTRHNAGFWFLEGLGHQGWVRESRFNGEVSKCQVDGRGILLLRPDTFMNRSGMAVGKMAHFYRLEPSEILVVHDELDLSVGKVRLKKDGGHAGHNGLRDIIANLGGRDFLRLRLGIGRPQNGQNVADYVLSEASKGERQLMDDMFERIYSHIDLIVKGDVNLAMNVLNP